MGINKFIGVGYLTRDAEVRQVGQNVVARFGLAIGEKFRKQDGTVGESTEFIDVDLWGQAGVHQYLVKGQMIYVEGSVRTEQWTGNDGQQRRTTRIRANMIQLLGNRQQAQQNQATAPQQYTQAPAPQYAPQPAPAPQYRRPMPQPQATTAPQYPQQYPQQQNAVEDLPADNYNPELGF